MSDMETITVTKTSTGLTMVTGMIGVGPMFHLNIEMLLLRMVEVVWHELRMRDDLPNILQKVDAHAVSFRHLELQIDQLSTTVNPRHPGTLPSNTI